MTTPDSSSGEPPRNAVALSDRLGARIGMTGGQVWTIAVLAIVIVLLLSSLRGLS